jgi:hypothetical protein
MAETLQHDQAALIARLDQCVGGMREVSVVPAIASSYF